MKTESQSSSALRLASEGAWGQLRGTLKLVEEVSSPCDPLSPACWREEVTILALLFSLLAALLMILVAFMLFRDDKEENVTPLCPQLVVREGWLTFEMQIEDQAEEAEVRNHDDPKQLLCKVVMDWPDPNRPCASGIASTARLQNIAGHNMATVVARNVAVSGQQLALCRSGCEIFGFVEPETEMRYHIKHRTGLHLLTVVGDFSIMSLEGINPVGVKVFSVKKEGNLIIGKVAQHIDAGLMISCLIASHMHRTLQAPTPVPAILTGSSVEADPFSPARRNRSPSAVAGQWRRATPVATPQPSSPVSGGQRSSRDASPSVSRDASPASARSETSGTIIGHIDV